MITQIKETAKKGKSFILNTHQLDYALILLISLSTFAWFEKGLLYFCGDWLMPLSPIDNLEHLFTWRELHGGNVSWGLGNVFLYGFFALFEKLKFSLAVTEAFYICLTRALSGIAMYYLAATFQGQGRDKRVICFIAALFYMYNPFIIGLVGIFVYFPYFALPFILSFWARGLRNKGGLLKYSFLISLASFGLLNEFPQYKMYLFAVIMIFVYLIFYLTAEKGDPVRAAKFAAASIVIWLLLHLWIILPFISFLSCTGMTKLTQGVNLTFPDTQWATVKEEFRLLGGMGFYVAASYARLYMQNPVLIITSFLTPVIAFSSLFFFPKRKDIAFFSSFSVIFIILAAGPNPPLGGVYKWVVLNIPIFKAFNTSHILAIGVTIGYAYLFANAIQALYRKFFSGSSKAKIFFMVGVLFIIICNSLPLVTGEFLRVPTAKKGQRGISLPDYYAKAGKFLDGVTPADFSLLVLPESSGYIQTTWGYIGGHLFPFFFKQPIFYTSIEGYGMTGRVEARRRALELAKKGDKDSLGKLLGVLNVRYIMIDHSLDMSPWTGFTPAMYEDNIKSEKGIRFVKRFGKLNLFEVSDFQPRIFVSSVASLNEAGESDFSLPLKGARIEYRRINPARYIVESRLREPYLLVFSQSFHPFWRMYLCKQRESLDKFTFSRSGILTRLMFLGRMKLVQKHVLVNNYANGWIVDPGKYKGGFFIIEFMPQFLFECGLIISLLTAAGCALSLFILYLMEKRRRYERHTQV